ncbi:MAG: tRNA pseudouridine(55) synthase TruB [Candidatus Pacebacteria bacterium]|jgi:tRNA pseudouridine55 synthase|nr:tRNA pseudouridine(55) synthase TruB [Candidatus Paceibacterota bacterium]MBT4652102.1 tRNA pseudouridine(55) synthase TruB [Candidatus Paceibacterota bacterium]MBT6756124.1 tRNA pseudouridine(55) synthase TruB [Candidatus Paceibacterota bacterium]MBT6921358.1 tRNA pseudouridine(55) synthase TruB [Candidatus Paceibacterota bacterium]
MTLEIPQSKPPAKDTEGIFLIDKPAGISSHGIVNKMRGITNIRRVGHTGTLDPLASGLLIILVGRTYTKLQDSFLKQDKTYTCTAKLGIETDTYDITGKIIKETPWEKLKYINSSAMEEVLQKLRGEIQQTVPPFSAVKQNGEKLYDKARKETLDKDTLPSRGVNIKQLVLLQLKKDINTKTVFFSLETTVSSGTYIRSLVHDIGKLLKVGATVTELRRTKIADYCIDNAFQIFDPKTFSFGKKFLPTEQSS